MVVALILKGRSGNLPGRMRQGGGFMACVPKSGFTKTLFRALLFWIGFLAGQI
jgi:hypothetical protein